MKISWDIRAVFDCRLGTYGVELSGSVEIGTVSMYRDAAAYKVGRF
jgi:hypothetical protein